MIPKTIHYCWFGKAQKPELALKCLESWRKYCQDYQIVEWNESNFDVNLNAYTKYCYENRKWAFLSDYARLLIIYEHGGLYFDTDVEVLRSFDPLLNNNAFFGFEDDRHVNTGLGFGAEKHHPAVLAMIHAYDPLLDGLHGVIGCPILNTEALTEQGLILDGKYQNLSNCTIYPVSYFNPYDDSTGRLNRTKNTFSVHWYAKSWMDKKTVLRSKLTRPIHRIFGKEKIVRNVGLKPIAKAIINLIRLYYIQLVHCPNFRFALVELFGFNVRIEVKKSSTVKLGKHIVTDGRWTLMAGDHAKISIGENVYFNENCMVSSKSSVVIGRGCKFGPNVKIFDNNHKFNRTDGVLEEHISKPVKIGKNCWIGSNAVILGGADIGDCCVIGAGCVVKEKIPAKSIVSHAEGIKIRPIEDR